MANFDLNSPFTFRPSYSDFAGSYYYITRITPDDPIKYKGPKFITITSNRLLSENEILAKASEIAQSRDKYSYGGTPLGIDITDAVIHRDLVPEV